MKKFLPIGVASLFFFILSGCSSFAGIRTPRYDGQPFEVHPEKIAAYEKNQEIIGEEKENYLPEPFSQDVLAPSLEVIENEPLLLEEGTYIIGEDVPAGRVTILGEKEDPGLVIGDADPFAQSEPEEYNVGTMTIRDSNDIFYFENMFHPYYGVQITQVDFIEGHTIHLYGSNPEIVVFYADHLPNNPYIFDTRWEEHLANLEAADDFEGFEDFEESEAEEPANEVEMPEVFVHEQEQPINISEDGRIVELKAGIYEVGEHIEPGVYEIIEQFAPTYTELFLFRENHEPRVFEMSEGLYGLTRGWGYMDDGAVDSEKPTIELLPGDKIYPHYVNRLMLTKIE